MTILNSQGMLVKTNDVVLITIASQNGLVFSLKTVTLEVASCLGTSVELLSLLILGDLLSINGCYSRLEMMKSLVSSHTAEHSSLMKKLQELMGISGDVPLCTDYPWHSALRSTNKHEKKLFVPVITLQSSKVLYESVGRGTLCVGKNLLSFSASLSQCDASYLAPKLFQSTKENTSKNKHESRRLRTKSSGHAHPVGSLACSTPNSWILLNRVAVKCMYLSSVISIDVLCSSSLRFVLSCSCKLIQTQTGRD